MIFRRDLLIIFIPFTLLTVFCIGGCAEDAVWRWVYFVAIPTPQNLSTLQTSRCSGLLNVFELNRVSKTVVGNHDFFYIYDYQETMPQHLYRVSTNECFQYPEVFFVPESIQMACDKISEKKIKTENPSEGTATDISISFDLTEYDCSGVTFTNELCVPCKSCPAKVMCYVLTGTCVATYVPQIPVVNEGNSCIRGYKNGNCSNICDPGTYGYLCSRKCSRHCVDGECHHRNGTCLKGCNPGWKRQECNEPDCPSNKFGPYCKYTCSPNCDGDCHDVDGTCVCKAGLRDDRDGYTGLICNNPCRPGTYGRGCSFKCEDCLRGTVCHPENGTCPNGCNEPGFYIESRDLAKCSYLMDLEYTQEYMWLRKKCQRGTYGINCQKNCSTACRNSYCRNTDGICLDCPAGFRGPECSIECTPGTFGENCDKKCRCENGAVCDAVSGRCPGKCIPGYEGAECSRKELHCLKCKNRTACEPGTYGSKCDKWCFCKDNKPCDRDSGRCPGEDLCQKGWEFSRCDYRDVCLYPPADPNADDSPVSWNAASLAIGIVIGIVAAFVFFGCRMGCKKIVK